MKKKSKKAKPKYKTMKFNVDQYVGAVQLVTSIQPPKGYRFWKMSRTGEDVTVKYVRE